MKSTTNNISFRKKVDNALGEQAKLNNAIVGEVNKLSALAIKTANKDKANTFIILGLFLATWSAILLDFIFG